MQAHEAHLKLETSRRHRFFAVMLLFLGAMNGVVLSNDMSFFYFFFEMTTLCSFLLIGHDNTPIAVKNSLRALWMNSLGGLVFVLAMMFVYTGVNSLDMQRLITGAASHNGIYLLALDARLRMGHGAHPVRGESDLDPSEVKKCSNASCNDPASSPPGCCTTIAAAATAAISKCWPA